MKYNKLIKTFTTLLTIAFGIVSIVYLQKKNLDRELVTDNDYYLI